MWNGNYFVCVSLPTLGLRIQLGHSGARCPNPRPGPSSFIVIHINGLHSVNLLLCNCALAPHSREQLLHHEWFPATVHQPHTCATFQVLHHFHLQSLQSKISTIHFYNALERETDNTGLHPPPVSSCSSFQYYIPVTCSHQSQYTSFLHIVREYHHLKLLKCGGQGHDTTGVDGTKNGELAVLCPACPYPSINLPDNWSRAPNHLQYVSSWDNLNITDLNIVQVPLLTHSCH